MMKHARSGKILTQMAIIIGLGIVIGVVDAFVTRPIDLNTREAPKDISEVLKPSVPTTSEPEPRPSVPVPDGPTQPDDRSTPPGPEVPAQDSASPNTTPSPAEAGAGVFKPTPKSALPPGQVTLEEAKTAFDGGAMFVDSRKLEDFKAGHVENAVRIESSMFKAGDPPELGLIPRSAIVVVYCNGGQCDESENVAKFLTNSGYSTVYVLHDGFPGWKALGYPIATGE
jgi:rhodanese-related sulfurtransferase